jgi:hypothetical protein
MHRCCTYQSFYGLGADAAVGEARRILVAGGVFYCLVKRGTGVELAQTKRGSCRFFQYFTPDTLRDLLLRHGFEVAELDPQIEDRDASGVDWLLALAIST